MATFHELLRDFLSPKEIETNIGILKVKYTESERTAINSLLTTLRARRVLFAEMDHELWEYVFKSLQEVRAILVQAGVGLSARSAKNLKASVDFMIDVISAYLAEHEASFVRFMTGPKYPRLGSAHKERNWPELGQAAEDLLTLRRLLSAATDHMSAFMGDRPELFIHPDTSGADFWIKYAKTRSFCEKCGFNMYYAYKAICPVCFPKKVPEIVALISERGKA